MSIRHRWGVTLFSTFAPTPWNDSDFYHILHVFSVLVLTAHTFMAFANPGTGEPPADDDDHRHRQPADVGQRLWHDGELYNNQLAGWMVVKLFCWLGFTALSGLAYRKAHLRGVFSFPRPWCCC